MKLHILMVMLLCGGFSAAGEPAARGKQADHPRAALSRSEDLLLLDNGTVRVGVDRVKGARLDALWQKYSTERVELIDP